MNYSGSRLQHLRFAHIQAVNTLKHARELESQLSRCPENVMNATDAYTFQSYAFPILQPVAKELVEESPVAYKKTVKQVLLAGIGGYVERYVSYAEWAYGENIAAARADYEQHANENHTAAIAEAHADGYDTTFAGDVASIVTPVI